jgi:hypothetical protein
MSSATFETTLTHQKRRASWNWYNLFIYCDATRENSKFKLFHQQPNFAYSKNSFALGAVAKSNSHEATDMLNLFKPWLFPSSF